jgi:transcriptional regulator with XRE-family HTH domain
MRKNLIAARKEKGMTQRQVAEKLGMNVRQYQSVEYGTVIGKVTTWDKLEDLLGIHQRLLREFIYPNDP